MVTDDVIHIHMLHIAADAVNMIEALISFRCLRHLMDRKKSLKLLCQENGVLHLSLRAAGMNAAPVHMEGHIRGVEVFIFQLAQRAAVHGVGIIRSEAFHIEMVHTAAHLFIGSKTDPHGSMSDFRMGQQIFRHGHDLRHAGLIVRTKKRGAVRDDQTLSDQSGKLRVLVRLHHDG